MARGPSGRVVIEIEPLLKKRLYMTLAAQDLTLKDWFINSAEQCIQNGPKTALNQELQSEKKDSDNKAGL
ncbi:hypothetical protein VDG64_21130 [Xanthomonas campestris pv. raphani]|uniref:hypothetical protein n=1 Tax=Xanthomonas campestris TaxID=339 RepID=UPI002B239D56|nr:hypothetical protein [Xanthomonas campestris]MEA9757438.1 hypothetical protein [Xanthomonas campestris pv. raphani]MEA9959221.1 hypothetical protein [Xanthomonas campestris pv. raphani]MEA9963268.1 hypothetical protein [Xanthomonas campestris pv. raphani]